MNLNMISKSDYIVSFGAMLSKDSKEIKESIIEAIAKNSAEFIYMHPIDDIDLKIYYSQFIKYEVGSEEGVLALLLEFFTKNRSDLLEEYISEFDIGYISAESSAGEEEFEEMVEKSSNKKSMTLILGDDIFSHERVENISKMIKFLEEFSDLNIVLIDEKNSKYLEMSDSNLEEVEELSSFNGTVLYTVSLEDESFIYGSESFSRVAKINDNDEIIASFANEKIKKVFKLDKSLQGTIALCSDEKLLGSYRYRQVKIEKVNAQ